MTYDFRFQLTSERNFHHWRFNVSLFVCYTSQTRLHLVCIEKLERNKEVQFPFRQKHKKKQNRTNNTCEMTSLQFTKKIKLDSKKQMQQLIHIWYLNCFLNQKWTCFIVCESCVFLCLVLEVTQGSDETTSFYETYLQECRSCLDHFRMKYRNPLECYCTLLKS